MKVVKLSEGMKSANLIFLGTKKKLSCFILRSLCLSRINYIVIKIDALYSGYLKRQENDIKSFKRDEKVKIPKNLNFEEIGGLSNEVIEKLTKIKPETISQASRISGITPVAIVSILRHLKRLAAGWK